LGLTRKKILGEDWDRLWLLCQGAPLPPHPIQH
jgi:hypothetical protein